MSFLFEEKRGSLGLLPQGKAEGRDSIRMKVFGERGMGFGLSLIHIFFGQFNSEIISGLFQRGGEAKQPGYPGDCGTPVSYTHLPNLSLVRKAAITTVSRLLGER